MVNADKIWLGWTPRESGLKGFRCVNGDAGKAQGKYQFDYRYALVPFMKFCMNFNSEHYAGFKSYIELGAGNTKLISNSGLASLWTELCDKYPGEFESLQNAYAYQAYYLPVKSQVLKLCNINLDNHSPAVKGSAFSMAIRSGTTSGAKKFNSCTDSMSDEEILRSAYGKYGSNDKNRWTEANQLGDALKAFKNNEFTYISPDGKIFVEDVNTEDDVKESTSTPSVPEEPKEMYRIGTAWENGKCVNQHNAFSVLANAIADSDKTRDEKHVTYYVFDSNGNIVHTSEYKKPETYRVGTAWVNGVCQNQHNAFSSLENAKKDCEEAKKENKKTYFVFDNSGNKVYSAVYVELKPESKILYRVGTTWANGKCINQRNAFSNLGYAKSCANANRNSYKVSHYVFDNDGNIVYSAEYSDPKDNYYRVGTSWSRGLCINQKGAFSVATNARDRANSLTKKTGTIYFVFDPTGKVIYTGSKK